MGYTEVDKCKELLGSIDDEFAVTQHNNFVKRETGPAKSLAPVLSLLGLISQVKNNENSGHDEK